MKLYWQSSCGRYKIYNSAAGEIVPDDLPPIDALVTDPPYELKAIQRKPDGTADYHSAGKGFMGHEWDGTGVSFKIETWKAILSKLKPGAHGLVFGGCRTFHRIAVAAEDAGFDFRDTLMWVTGQGFPKGADIGKQLDKKAGAVREVIAPATRHAGQSYKWAEENRNPGHSEEKSGITAPSTDLAKQWDGWNTNLKPGYEPILLLRKPVEGTLAENVITHGVGGINIGACRVPGAAGDGHWTHKRVFGGGESGIYGFGGFEGVDNGNVGHTKGRYPANFLHDGSPEVLECFPDAGGQQGDLVGHNKDSVSPNGIYGSMGPKSDAIARIDESKSAARFFYCAKVSKKERNEGMGDSKNNHVTVKPQGLMQFCNRLICPPGGIILDPFLGSGSTMVAAVNQGFSCIGVDISEEYCEIAKRRVEHALKKLGDDVDEKSKISSTKQSPVPLDNTIQPELLLS